MEWKTVWKQKEFKYLLDETQYKILQMILHEFGKPQPGYPSYTITTRYLGSWKNASGASGKIRERTYSTGGHYIEEKIREKYNVYKHRLPFEQYTDFITVGNSIKKMDITVSYQREPWIIKGVRITIDTAPFIPGYLMEIKGCKVRHTKRFLERALEVMPKDISKHSLATQ